MPTYVVLVNFTDQGIRNIKQSTERTRAAMAMAEKLGIKVRNIYLTLGEYDGLIIGAPSRRRRQKKSWQRYREPLVTAGRKS